MQLHSLLNELYTTKPLEYPLVWGYIISLNEDITAVRIDTKILLSILNINKPALWRILEHGCDKAGYEFNSRNNQIVFRKKINGNHVASMSEISNTEIKEEILSKPPVENQTLFLTQKAEKDKQKTIRWRKYAPLIVMAVERLNLRTGARYLVDGKTVLIQLPKLFKKNYSIQDVIDVIDYKCAQWMIDEKMRIYCRPEILFSEVKFESYINEIRMARGANHIAPTTHYAKPSRTAKEIINNQVSLELDEFKFPELAAKGE